MKSELLAPAGSFESLKTALHFGADAVYLGGPLLQLRAEASAFSMEALQKSVEYAHERKKKIYVALNCFAENDEIPLVGPYAKELREIGADGVIVSDLGVIAEIREKCPDLPVHVSTQANTQNWRTINVYKEMGCARVVLGREMTLPAIEALSDRVSPGIELEAFIHGAMCMAYSGRCLLSSYLNHRSGNRGECSQPCRWNYYVVEEKRRNTFIPVAENEGATAIFSSTDLKSISFLDRLEQAGIGSFKIEGRMKSPYYVATVVNAYRHYMNGTAPLSVCEKELDCASHRPYSSGFYFGECKTDPNNDGLYRQDCKFIGVVVGSPADGEYTIEMRNAFSLGERLEILSPDAVGLSFTVTEIRGENGQKKEKADIVQEKVTVPCPYVLREGDIVRKRL